MMQMYMSRGDDAGFQKEELAYQNILHKILELQDEMEIISKACAAQKGKRKRSLGEIMDDDLDREEQEEQAAGG